MLDDDSVCLITRVDGNFISGWCLNFVNSLYCFPYPSKILGIGHYRLSANFVSMKIPVRKCVCFKTDEFNFVIFPFLE